MKKIVFSLLPALFAALSVLSCAKKEAVATEPDTTPRLVSIAPRTYVSGGTAIISGYWFSEKPEDNVVLIDGSQATVTAATKDRLTIVLPAHADGDVEVRVSVGGVKSPDILPFTYATLPGKDVSITAISPPEGYVGDDITLFGDNFSTTASENSVLFGDAAATVTTATRKALTVKAPEHTLGAVTVKVTVNGKDATARFTYLKKPVLRIDAVSPASGKVGDVVRISGEGFSETAADNRVTMGLAGAEVKDAAENWLDIVIPDQPGGNYDFHVQVGSLNAAGGSFSLEKSWRIETVAGNGTGGTAQGVGTKATVNIPQDCVLGPDGLVWFTQRGGGHSVRTFNPESREVKNIAVRTASAYTWIQYPWGCTFDRGGQFWFVCKGSAAEAPNVGYWNGSAAIREEALDESVQDTGNPMCIQCGSDGTLYVLCRAATSVIYKFKDGGVTGQFDIPGIVEHMVVSPDGSRLFLGTGGTSGSSYILRTLNLSDGTLTTVAGCGRRATGAEDYTDGTAGSPLTARIGLTEGMCFGSDGTLYFTDVSAFTLRSLTPGPGGDYASGTVRTLAGTPFSNVHADGLGSRAGLVYPCGLAALKDGSLILLDGTGHRIRRVYLK